VAPPPLRVQRQDESGALFWGCRASLRWCPSRRALALEVTEEVLQAQAQAEAHYEGEASSKGVSEAGGLLDRALVLAGCAGEGGAVGGGEGEPACGREREGRALSVGKGSEVCQGEG
jgi:hypothetical protein